MKIAFALLIVFLSVIALAQEPLFDRVKEGKKVGVKKKTNDEWLIPLGKHQIFQPATNLFLKVDQKNKTVQTFYKDHYHTITSK